MRPMILLAHDDSSRPGGTSVPPRCRCRRGPRKPAASPPRTVTLVGRLSTLGRLITTTHSHDAMGGRRDAGDPIVGEDVLRSSIRTPEVSSEAEPRCTMMALSGSRWREAPSAKPADIESSTRTPRPRERCRRWRAASPASARGRCGCCTRAEGPWLHRPQDVGDASSGRRDRPARGPAKRPSTSRDEEPESGHRGLESSR